MPSPRRWASEALAFLSQNELGWTLPDYATLMKLDNLRVELKGFGDVVGNRENWGVGSGEPGA